MPVTTIQAPQREQQNCALFKLSPELRNDIYELALGRDGDTRVMYMYVRGQPSGQPLSLLATCRQIYHEAAAYFYHSRHICFQSSFDCERFISSNGAKHISAVREVSAMMDEDYVAEAERLLAMLVAFPSLRKLTFITMGPSLCEDGIYARCSCMLRHTHVLDDLKARIERLPKVEEIYFDVDDFGMYMLRPEQTVTLAATTELLRNNVIARDGPTY